MYFTGSPNLNTCVETPFSESQSTKRIFLIQNFFMEKGGKKNEIFFGKKY